MRGVCDSRWTILKFNLSGPHGKLLISYAKGQVENAGSCMDGICDVCVCVYPDTLLKQQVRLK